VLALKPGGASIHLMGLSETSAAEAEGESEAKTEGCMPHGASEIRRSDFFI